LFLDYVVHLLLTVPGTVAGSFELLLSVAERRVRGEVTRTA
jgi:hypothetical protein